jgi:hypothetical protein
MNYFKYLLIFLFIFSIYSCRTTKNVIKPINSDTSTDMDINSLSFYESEFFYTNNKSII